MKRKVIALIGSIFLLTSILIWPGFAEEESIPLGEYYGDTYTNDFIGIGCTLEGWRYDTLMELAQRSNISVYDEDLQEMMQKTQTFLLMFAEAEDASQNVGISVAHSDGVSALVDQFGIKVIVETLFPEMMQQYSELYGPQTEGRIISREIDGKTFYGYMVNYTIGEVHTSWEQLTLTAGNYVVTITATGSSEEEADGIYEHFFLVKDTNNNSSNSTSEIYTGKKRPITFSIPVNWHQSELHGVYSDLEASFVPADTPITQIQYACMDLIEKSGYSDNVRFIFSMNIFTEEMIKEMLEDTIEDFVIERKSLGSNEWFILRGRSIVPVVSALHVENGYFHQIALYEAKEEQRSAHEADLFSLLSSVKFPND